MSNSATWAWDDALIVPVIQVEKGKVTHLRDRVIRNAPLKYFWGRELVERYGTRSPVVVIEWRGKITAADLRTPVKFRGVEYDGSWASGSMIKSRKTFGFLKGFKPLAGAMEFEEQATKVGRALLPDSIFALAGEWRVRTVDVKQSVGWMLEGDGFAYIKESLLPSGWRDNAVRLGICKQNYQLWQQLTVARNYDEILKQVLAFVDNWWATKFVPLVSGGKLFADDYRVQLVEANHEMARHPYYAAKSDESVASSFRQIATCPMVDQDMWLAVPGTDWGLPAGRYLVSRFPIASYYGVMCINSSGEPQIAQRLLGCVQGTFTARRSDKAVISSAKFLVGVVADKDWPDPNSDIITSVENWKLGPGDLGTATFDGVLSVMQSYGPERLLSVPLDVFKLMAGDVDGDLVAVAEYPEEMPALEDALRSLPEIKGMKGIKTHTALGDRGAAEFLLNAMNANLGWATNNRSSTFATTRQQRKAIAHACHEHGMIVKADTFSLDVWLTSMVQDTVDALKSHIKTAVINGRMGKLNGVLGDVIGGTPAYLRWKGSEWAWKAGRPMLWSQLPPEQIALAAVDKDFRKGPEMKSHMRDETEGLIAEIFRHQCNLAGSDGTLLLQTAWEASGHEIEPLPLVHFRDWAPSVDKRDVEAAKAFQIAWDAWLRDREASRINKEYNPEDLDDQIEWHEMWRSTCMAIVKEKFGGDMHVAAYALWHLLHSSASKLSTAAAVFIGFPTICLEVCEMAEQRMDLATYECIFIGFGHNFIDMPVTFEGTVDVVGNEVHSASGHPLLRNGSLVAMLGDISVKNADAGMRRPPEGHYVCRAVPFSTSGKTWQAVLTPIRRETQ